MINIVELFKKYYLRVNSPYNSGLASLSLRLLACTDSGKMAIHDSGLDTINNLRSGVRLYGERRNTRHRIWCRTTDIYNTISDNQFNQETPFTGVLL